MSEDEEPKSHPDAGRIFVPEPCRKHDHPMPAVFVDDAGRLRSGMLQPMVEGQPISVDPSTIYAQREPDGNFRVVKDTPTGASGPPQVANDAYRSGWSRTFDRALN